MADFQSGRGVSLDDQEQWRMLIITEGQIIEVHLASSSMSGPEDTWAAFYVLESTLLPDASLSLLVRFLGVEVDVLAETLT